MTSHSVTGIALRKLMFKPSICTVLDLLRPNVNSRVTERQVKQKHKKCRTKKVINVGDSCVYNRKVCKWTVEKRLGVVMLLIIVNGKLCKRHINQLRVIDGDTNFIGR